MKTMMVLILGLAAASPAWSGLDCDAVLARCDATPARCSAGKLKKCVKQGNAVCAPPTTPTTTTTTTTQAPQAAHCAFCPTAHCQADGTTCEECGTGGICDPDFWNPCCDHPPQPIDPSDCNLGTSVEFIAFACGEFLPPGHGCCRRFCAQP